MHLSQATVKTDTIPATVQEPATPTQVAVPLIIVAVIAFLMLKGRGA